MGRSALRIPAGHAGPQLPTGWSLELFCVAVAEPVRSNLFGKLACIHPHDRHAASFLPARRDRTVKLDFYRRLGVAEYRVADPDAEQAEAWPFAVGATEPERYADRAPARLGGQVVGEIELAYARPTRSCHRG